MWIELQPLEKNFHRRYNILWLRWVKIGRCNHKNFIISKNLTYLTSIWKHSRFKWKPTYCGPPECRVSGDIISKTNYHPTGDTLRITTVMANLWYPKIRNKIWRDFGAEFCHRFNLDTITCFKVISQVTLVDANS